MSSYGYVFLFGSTHLSPWAVLWRGMVDDLSTWLFWVVMILPWLRRSWHKPMGHIALSMILIQVALLAGVFSFASRIPIAYLSTATLEAAIPLALCWHWTTRRGDSHPAKGLHPVRGSQKEK